MKKQRKKILVVGMSRSSTKSMTWYLQSLGLDVLHEKMGPDGTVSCYMHSDFFHHSWEEMARARNHNQVPRHTPDESPSNFKFDLIVHLVRHPLWVIPSNCRTMWPEHEDWLTELGFIRHGSKPKAYRMMQAWIAINEKIETMTKDIVTVDNAVDKMPALLKRIGVAVPKGTPYAHRHKRTTGSAYEKKPMSWDQFEFMDYPMAQHMKSMVKRYKLKEPEVV